MLFFLSAFESMLFPQSITVEEYFNPAVPHGHILASFSMRSHFGIPGLRTYTGRLCVYSCRFSMQSFGDDVYRENTLTAGGYFSALAEISLGGELALYHHEWWNGEGYPRGLIGKRIPLEARIIAIIEAYDAMTHGRPYKKKINKESAISELRAKAGTQFDPELVEIFINLL